MHGLRVALHQLRTSLQTQMQYRVDFLLQIATALYWIAWSFAPLLVVFGLYPATGPLTLDDGLLVLAGFLVLKGLLESVIAPNLTIIVEHIRRGTLDFVLLKPVDSQILVSTAKIVPSRVLDTALGLGLGLFSALQRGAGPTEIVAALALLACGAVLMYSMWLIAISSAFWLVSVNNLSHLFNSIFDTARWPRSLFPPAVRTVFTFAIPVLAMTSFPALAALGKISSREIVFVVGAALGSAIFSRALWRFALRSYSSASS